MGKYMCQKLGSDVRNKLASHVDVTKWKTAMQVNIEMAKRHLILVLLQWLVLAEAR